MPRYTAKSREVEAVRLTDAIALVKPGSSVARRGEPGDWLVTDEHGHHCIVPHPVFIATYRESDGTPAGD